MKNTIVLIEALVKKDKHQKDRENLELLSSIDFIKWIPFNRIPIVMDLFKEENYKKNQMIIKAGDLGQDFYIVKNGQVRIYSDKIDNFFSKVVLRGDYFGEASIIKQEHRLANVIALEDSVCLKINSLDFKWIFDSNATGVQVTLSPLGLFENLFNLRRSQDAEIISLNKVVSKMKEKERCMINMLIKIIHVEKG